MVPTGAMLLHSPRDVVPLPDYPNSACVRVEDPRGIHSPWAEREGRDDRRKGEEEENERVHEASHHRDR